MVSIVIIVAVVVPVAAGRENEGSVMKVFIPEPVLCMYKLPVPSNDNIETRS